jgi:cysteine desulfurase
MLGEREEKKVLKTNRFSVVPEPSPLRIAEQQERLWRPMYFDHNATTPLLPVARQTWLDATEEFIGNPSSPHRVGARAEIALDAGREKLAAFLSCGPLEIIWTSGATESNNAVLHHLARSLGKEAEIWISATEHPCVVAGARHYFPGRHRLIPARRSGIVDLDWLEAKLYVSRPGAVAVMAANNETGVLQPWREVLSLCRQHQVPVFCDAAQWIGKEPARGLGECEYVSGCAHKFGGPRGVGFLKVAQHGRFYPLLRGGGQEAGRRAGTENVAGVLSMIAALEHREHLLTAHAVSEKIRLREEFETKLEATIPGTEIVGRHAERLWNTVSVLTPPSKRRQRWVVKLDKLGFAVSTGSACASGSEEPSHVLAAMGYAPDEVFRALRFSSCWETTGDDWAALLDALEKVYFSR